MCRKSAILTHGFTPLPKEVVLRIFSSKKILSTTDGFESVNLGSSGEYDNHGTTGVDVPDTMQSCQPQSNIGLLEVKEMYTKSKEIL